MKNALLPMPDSRCKVILGSGTSYGAPPSDLSDWQVHAVRGPLTASLIGMPDKAVTDAAILVSDHIGRYGVQPKRDGRRTIIIPHHYSIDGARWTEAADKAGMTYVSPRSTVEEILAHISQADLVITEAMHGAILADTLRIPWIPITCSPDFDLFKWRDWALSMELEITPNKIGPTSAQKAISYWKKALSGPSYPPLPSRLDLSHVETRDMLSHHLQSRYQGVWHASAGTRRVNGVKKMLTLFDDYFIVTVGRQLREIAHTKPLLSHDSLFKARLQTMRNCVDRFIDDTLHTRLRSID